jgi:hypothetical protein
MGSHTIPSGQPELPVSWQSREHWTPEPETTQVKPALQSVSPLQSAPCMPGPSGAQVVPYTSCPQGVVGGVAKI